MIRSEELISDHCRMGKRQCIPSPQLKCLAIKTYQSLDIIKSTLLSLLSIILLGLLHQGPVWPAEVELPVVTQQNLWQADFDQPTAVATSTDGRVFILDGMKSRIVIFSAGGKQLSVISSNEQLPNFSKAVGLSWANGKLYIADTAKHRILVLTDLGKLSRIINLPVTFPEQHWPEPVAISIRNETLFYTDRRHHRLCLISLETAEIQLIKQQCVGQRGEQSGEFQFPYQIAIDKDDYLHVVDVINGRVQVFNSRGQYFSQEGKFAVDELYRPNGITIDALGYQYVSDAYLGTIAVFEKGRYRGTLNDTQGQAVKFTTPVGLWADNQYLYVIDTATNSAHKLQLTYQTFDEKIIHSTRQFPDLSRKNCIACHFSWGFIDDHKLEDKQGIAPVASSNMCYSCHHGVVFESRQAIPPLYAKGQHPTLYDPLEKKENRQKKLPRKDEIPKNHPLLADGELQCTTCHTPHNPENNPPTLYVDNSNSWMRIINKDSDMCENCHESNKKTARERDTKKRGINHPLGFKLMKAPKGDKSGNYSKDPHLQKGLPKSFIAGGAMLGINQEMTCQSCHQIHGGKSDNLVAVNDESGEMCGECHKRQSSKGLKSARKKGVHPVNVKLEKPVTFRGQKIKKVICQSCHDVHDGTLGTPLFPDKIKNAEKLCIACHQRQHAKNKKEAIKKGIHLVNEKLDDAVKIGGQRVKQMGCLSCHSIHKGKPNTPALLVDHSNGELCENCHKGKQRVVGSNHDFRVTAKKSENNFEELPIKSGACGTCHSMHKGKGKMPYLSSTTLTKKKERDKTAPLLAVDELCLNCHQKDGIGKEKPIAHYGHPYKDIILRSNPEVMPLLNKQTEKIDEKTNLGIIACITCHEPHTWEPLDPHKNKDYPILNYKKQKNVEGNVLNSFLRKKGINKTFCVDCHSIEALTKYKYYHHKNKVRGIGVDYLK